MLRQPNALRLAALVLAGALVVAVVTWLALRARSADAPGTAGVAPLPEGLMVGWQLDGRAVSQPTFRPGETHCEWGDALVLSMVWPAGADPAPDAHRSFVRDPGGVMDEFTAAPFVPDAELPDDAVDTGYENDAGIELWLAGDLATAFVVDGDTVEAWPALGAWVCA